MGIPLSLQKLLSDDEDEHPYQFFGESGHCLSPLPQEPSRKVTNTDTWSERGHTIKENCKLRIPSCVQITCYKQRFFQLAIEVGKPKQFSDVYTILRHQPVWK
eukprot:gb/GECG01012679.1/.p1 GENE.gb/GECG01012679.1/~~gb/GECG01012679.1/.p1  ORF type:complete len:103 (+),score=5.83 gb/GECG01012679.1/:1-309(+)